MREITIPLQVLDVTAMLLVTSLTCLDPELVMVETGTVTLTLSITNGKYIYHNRAWYYCNWYSFCLLLGKCWVQVQTKLYQTRDFKTGTYCCFVKCVTSIVKVREMPWHINRCNLLPCTVSTFMMIDFKMSDSIPFRQFKVCRGL